MAALRRIAGGVSINEVTATLRTLTINDVNNSLSRQLPSSTQARWMSRMKRRHTMPPFWLPKITRTMYPENITPENQAFVSEVIANQYSSPLKSDPWERGQWTEKVRRCGVIARKIGIYPMWKKDGTRLLTTLLQVSDNHVIKYIPPEEMATSYFNKRTGNVAGLVVGADSIDPREATKEFQSLFVESGVLPKRKVSKFVISPSAKLAPGTPLYASHFRPGDYVDILGITIDRGFQGVMKRWGFKGLPASHGVTKAHRAGGNIGGGGEKGRVWPGTKMPGHMGRNRRILRGVKIWRINTRHNVIWVSGPAVPGSVGSYVNIYDCSLPTRKINAENHPPFPTFFQDEEDIEEELYDADLHVFSDKSVTFAEK
ncbi:large ribosomal subunit protein uL3m-like isoform X1 [Macrobrachium nipponense]|uniref:large ribosomal subunit protein uL3m-like isoform X1 n=2 Tax=Macrobrachium nipponense TaxID=159736 RepID=UPI0030C811C3